MGHRVFFGRKSGAAAGIAHENVDPPQPADDSIHQPDALGGVGQIDFETEKPPTERFDLAANRGVVS